MGRKTRFLKPSHEQYNRILKVLKIRLTIIDIKRICKCDFKKCLAPFFVGLLACHWVLIGHHCHTTDLTFGLFICHTISFCPNFYLYCWDCRIFLLISWQLLTRPTTCRVVWGHFCSFLNIFFFSIMLQLKLRFFWGGSKNLKGDALACFKI